MQTLTAHMPSGMSTIVWSETDKQFRLFRWLAGHTRNKQDT